MAVDCGYSSVERYDSRCVIRKQLDIGQVEAAVAHINATKKDSRKGIVYPNSLSVEFRSLNPEDANDVLRLENEAHAQLGNAYCPLPFDSLQNLLSQSISLGAYVDRNLVGIRLARAGESMCSERTRHALITDAEFDDAVELRGLVVDPCYRGSGLANMLMDYAIRQCVRAGYRHFFSSVGLANYASLKMVFSSHFLVRNIALSGDNSMRFLVRRDYYEDRNYGIQEEPVRASSAIHFVPFDDVAGHTRLLTAGYAGSCIKRSRHSFSIGYTPYETPHQPSQLVSNL